MTDLSRTRLAFLAPKRRRLEDKEVRVVERPPAWIPEVRKGGRLRLDQLPRFRHTPQAIQQDAVEAETLSLRSLQLPWPTRETYIRALHLTALPSHLQWLPVYYRAASLGVWLREASTAA